MLKINELTRIYLGCQGENLAKTIEIDMQEWLVDHPNGTVTVWYKRNGDVEATPAAGISLNRETAVLTWTPTSTDTYVSGEGEAEFRLTEGNIIKKHRKVITGVSPAVTGAGTPLGSGWQDYIDAIEKAAQVAIIKEGALRFSINEDGHMILAYTTDVPIVEDEEEEEEATNE